MKIAIWALGRPPTQGWLAQGLQDYSARLQHYVGVEQVMIPDKKVSALHTLKLRLAQQPHWYLLDADGQPIDSESLKECVQSWQNQSINPVFVIGDADGFPTEFKKTAPHIWSLSSAVLPHHLARLILLEQLYRAYTMMTGHPYHRQ